MKPHKPNQINPTKFVKQQNNPHKPNQTTQNHEVWQQRNQDPPWRIDQIQKGLPRKSIPFTTTTEKKNCQKYIAIYKMMVTRTMPTLWSMKQLGKQSPEQPKTTPGKMENSLQNQRILEPIPQPLWKNQEYMKRSCMITKKHKKSVDQRSISSTNLQRKWNPTWPQRWKWQH